MFQNLIGYNEKSDLYSLAATACEMANGLVPFSEMPGTLMLVRKIRNVIVVPAEAPKPSKSLLSETLLIVIYI